MYCNRCGNNLPPDSQFCNRCGNRIETENHPHHARPNPAPMTRPARRRLAIEDQFPEEPYVEEYDDTDEYDDFEDEDDVVEVKNEDDAVFTIFPAFYEVGSQYLLAILLSVFVTALIAYLRLPLWIALVFSAGSFIKPIYRHILNRNTVYKLTPTKIEIKSGLFSIKSRNIPLRHIQDVSVSETFKERLIGIGDVVIDSAAIEGKIFMRNIKNPRKYANMILDQL
jgi:membrane protein YdbS with pleckstrin-like domain